MDRAPRPAGELIAVRLALHPDLLRPDAELRAPEAPELLKILVRVILDRVVELGGREPTDPAGAELDDRHVGVGDAHGVTTALVALGQIERDEVAERRILSEIAEARTALGVRLLTQQAVLPLHGPRALELGGRRWPAFS